MTTTPLPATTKLRMTQTEAAALLGVSRNQIAKIERLGECPPRVALPGCSGSNPKRQFITAEFVAFANGDGDWQAMVEKRLGPDWRESL